METPLNPATITPKQRLNRLIFNLLIRMVGAALILAGVYGIVIRMRFAPLSASDFQTYFAAANHLRLGESIYADANFQPPLTALLFVPLAFLPQPIALLAWNLITIGLYLWMVWAVLRESNILLPATWKIVLLGLALCWFPFQTHLSLGQISIFLCAGIVLAWLLLRRKREVVAGGILGLLVLLKLFPGIFAFYLLLRKRWTGLVAMLGTIVAGSIITWIIIGSEDFSLYLSSMVANSVESYAAYPINLSLTGIFSRMFVEAPWVKPLIHAPRLATLCIFLASAGILVLLIFHNRKVDTQPQGDNTLFGLTCIAMLLISPLTWQHILPIMVLPFVIVLSLHGKQARTPLKLFILLAFALISLPDIEIADALMKLYIPNQTPWPTAAILLLPDIGLVFLCCLLIHPARYEQG